MLEVLVADFGVTGIRQTGAWARNGWTGAVANRAGLGEECKRCAIAIGSGGCVCDAIEVAARTRRLLAGRE